MVEIDDPPGRAAQLDGRAMFQLRATATSDPNAMERPVIRCGVEPRGQQRRGLVGAPPARANQVQPPRWQEAGSARSPLYTGRALHHQGLDVVAFELFDDEDEVAGRSQPFSRD